MGKPVFQPLFRRGLDYVVVRPIRISAKVTWPVGRVVKWGELKHFQTRALYQRRRLGPKDSPWTEHMLQSWEDGKPLAKPEVTGPVEPEKSYVIVEPTQTAPVQEPEGSDETGQDQTSQENGQGQTDETAEATETDQTQEPPAAEPLVPVKDGSKWSVPGHEGGFKTKKAAQAFIDKLDTEPEGDGEPPAENGEDEAWD